MRSPNNVRPAASTRGLLGCSLLVALASSWLCLPSLPIIHAAEPSHSGCDHVHIFLITGIDPNDLAHLKRIRRYCQDLGFRYTQRGHWYDQRRFEQQIRCIRREDPEARFVLVGYSLGANVVRSMAQSLARNNDANIDLMVYIAGNLLKYWPQDLPTNVAKVVHIMADSNIYRETPTVGADNYKLTNTGHIKSPTHPQTLDILARELAEIAASVPAHPDDATVP